jgi:hypothetical protein
MYHVKLANFEIVIRLSVTVYTTIAKGGTSEKKYCHRASTKFRLGVIRRVYELFKRPSYNYVEKEINSKYTDIIIKSVFVEGM